MSGAVVLIMFLAALLTAARLFLRPEHRPPIPTREAEGDPSRGASLEGDDRACMRRSKSTGASRTMDLRDQAGCDDD